MEEFSTEEPKPKQRRTVAAAYSSSHGGPRDLLERSIKAVLKCLGFVSISKTHQSTSYDPLPSTEAAQEPPSASELGMKSLEEDQTVKSVEVSGRRPKAPTVDPGSGPQHN